MKDIEPQKAPGFLIGRVAHLLKLNVNKFLKEENIKLSSEEISILTVLAYQDNEKSMNELSLVLGRDATTLKRQLDSLEKSSFIKRRTSSLDARKIVVEISLQGKKMVEKTLPMTFTLREKAMEGISESEVETLVTILLKMTNNLNIKQRK